MILPLADKAAEFMELRFKSGMWESHGVPEAGCRLRTEAMERIIASGGTYQIEQLIHGLMDWLDVTDDPEPALGTLQQMLDRHYPDDGRGHARCHFAPEEGGEYIFNVARKIACDRPLVTWQRRQWIIALGAASNEPTRMIVGAPAPISLQVAQSILGHSLTSFMLEPFDSYEGARATSRKTGSYYGWAAGQATLIDWDHGLGLTMRDGELAEDEELVRPPNGGWLPPSQLAIQVAIAGGYLP